MKHWEVWRALKKLELLLAMPQATLTHLSCSPNFPYASYVDERMLMYEPIVNGKTFDSHNFSLYLNKLTGVLRVSVPTV